jgi:hypothetical protein
LKNLMIRLYINVLEQNLTLADSRLEADLRFEEWKKGRNFIESPLLHFSTSAFIRR